MALPKGEQYRCPDLNCGCEIEVTKGAPLAKVAIKHRAAVAVRRCKSSIKNFTVIIRNQTRAPGLMLASLLNHVANVVRMARIGVAHVF